MKKHFEAIVIGAGYIGCSAAYYLSKAGVKTALLDRDSVGGGASRANFGLIQVQDAELDFSIPMVTEGYRQCLEIETELDRSVGYNQLGSLIIIETEKQWEIMKSRLPRVQKGGIEAEFVPAERLPEIEPLINSKNLLGGLYNPYEGQIIPFDLMWAYVSRAQERGLKFFPNTEVQDFIIKGDKIKSIITNQGHFELPVIILTTGAWTRRLGKKLGKNWKIDFVHGEAFLTQAIERVLHNYVVSSAFLEGLHGEGSEDLNPDQSTSAIPSITQSPYGHLLLAEASFPTDQIGYHVTPSAPSAIAYQVTKVFPSFAKLSALRSWASPVAYTNDGLPFLGPVDDLPGLFLATAFRSTVITTPIAGKTIAQLVTEGQSDLDINAFSPDRAQ